MADADYESVLCVKPEVHVYRIPPRASNRGYSVVDSSRYFVICIEDGTGSVTPGRRAFIGVGFADRGDAFDFNVALQDHFKWVKQQAELAKQAQNPEQGPRLDLGFKEGQTIKINIANIKKKEGSTKPRPLSGTLNLLPPPPGAKVPVPSASPAQPATPTSTDLLLELGAPSPWAGPPAPSDMWGDFTKASGAAGGQQTTGWVQF
ncbi:hypothetical protein XELAEV_18037958mg [Xenopus laevis]|uniref:NECAP PHear domain-containing protein n=1 Tax=Xenopus laevis TaxID=8355 RepID=A0A974CD40_XENLA|nr:hypothetical protein XELAEV_18037958mg [Xenopus laevis]